MGSDHRLQLVFTINICKVERPAKQRLPSTDREWQVSYRTNSIT